MARRVSRRTHQQVLMETWWIRAALAVACLVLAYVFILLAADSAKTIEYILAIVFVWFGVRHALLSVRLAFFG